MNKNVMYLDIGHWEDDRDEVIIVSNNRPNGEQFSNCRGTIATKSAMSDFLLRVKNGDYDHYIQEN